MSKWKFYQQPDGRWRWWHDDPHEGCSRSESAFVSRNDCIANAMVHGYLPVSPVVRCTAPAMASELPRAIAQSACAA
jgi:hypothetical protein